MSLTYVVTSKTARVIEGLGVFSEGETRELDGAETLLRFQQVRGVQLLPANLPDDVELSIRINHDETVETVEKVI